MDYSLSTNWTMAIVVLAIWELAWKGLALWRAAKKSHTGWYLAILLINTAGILPIIYLLMHNTKQDSKEAANETLVSVG